jgi:peroxiredoxin
MLTVGDNAPAFRLSDQSGNTINLSGFKGRKVLTGSQLGHAAA